MQLEKIKNKEDEDGFSNQDDLEAQQYDNPKINQLEISKKGYLTKLNNAYPPEFKDKVYSLHPDIITGWIPKITLFNPIPLSFRNQSHDLLIEKVLNNKDNQKITKLCYLGPRQESTYHSWYSHNFQFPYNHIKSPQSVNFTNREFQGQLYSAQGPSFIVFNSFFQSGNLDAAFRIGEYNYELFMRVDSNTKGHLQWFNFNVKNMKRGKRYKFTICNFQKSNILYKKNMRPYILSERKQKLKGQNWCQLGSQVNFHNRQSVSCKQYDIQQLKKFYRLSFQYQCQFDNDTVQIAYCVPYTYSSMIKQIQQIKKQTEKQEFEHKILKVSKLGNSLGGLQLPMLIITSNVQQYVRAQRQNKRIQKKMIIISGRSHPGQSNGSFMIEGLIKFLVGNSKQAEFLRSKLVFKIIPMLNPDGVILGNYRTGVSGKDFNRQFVNPDKIVFPEVYAIKQLVRQAKQLYGKDLIMFLDFHGHSVRKNIFMYGPEFSLLNRNYYQCRIFPKLISLKTQKFRYYSCSFKLPEFKESTARGVLFKNFNIPLTYTIEASNGFYFNRQTFSDTPFEQSDWIGFGLKIGEALYDYISITLQNQMIKNERLEKRIAQNQEKKKANNQIKIQLKQGKKRLFKTLPNFNQEIRTQTIFLQDSIHRIEQTDKQNKKILQIMEEIQREDSLRARDHNSQDEISEGSSDNESQSNDFNKNQMKVLIQHIKQKPITKRATKNKSFKNVRSITQTDLIINSTVQEQKKVQTQFQQQVQNVFKSRQQSIKKNYYVLKKSSLTVAESPSPKKQNKQIIGKVQIKNFNFQLTAIPLTKKQSRTNLKIMAKKSSYKNISYSGIVKEQCKSDQKRICFLPYQYSSTFQRTFMSVKKQILRKQNARSKSSIHTNLRIQNIKGKKLTLKSKQ